MVISDLNKYVFVELPFTASTAISRELREHYGGQKFLTKHANYSEFMKIASPEQRAYFAFSGIRNPLDEAVSNYVKLRTNPNNIYTDPQPWMTPRLIRRYQWVSRRNATFSEYLHRFYFLPHETWSSLDHKQLDYVYHLETVTDDFAEILQRIGLDPVRPLPLRHQTAGKASWQSYYTPDTYARARFVFGPKMDEWGYQFPEEWDVGLVQAHARAIYWLKARLKNSLRRLRMLGN